MSEILQQLRKKGGGNPRETNLWINPTPTTASSAYTISLLDSVPNFDKIRVYFAVSTTTIATTYFLDFDIDLFLNAKATNGSPACGITCFYASNAYMRRINYNNATSLTITSAYPMNATGQNTSLLIVTKITGLKY